MNELEKEKMMRELEVKELMTKHRNELRNLEMQLSSLKDNECDLQGRIDQLSKERDEALASARDQPGPRVIEASGDIEKLEKQLREEKLKKDQAINKLAEMMMRKDLQPKP